jgi:hypothetical protein
LALTAIAKCALEDHIPLLIGGVHATRYGWKVSMDWETGVCHVRMMAKPPPGAEKPGDAYTVRLTFDYYPIEQPGVIFVDPVTNVIGTSEQFERWWPNIDGNPWINVQISQGSPESSYLCFQWTQEFKRTHSAPPDEDPKKWDPEKHNVVGVVGMVQRALRSSFYKGYRKQ